MRQRESLVNAFSHEVHRCPVVRWLGNRKGIEETTTTWDKAIVDREPDLKLWVNFLHQMVLNKQLRKIFAFANNHYAGHAPDTIKVFEKLWPRQA